MNYCLNPACDKPQNSSNFSVCQNCGAKLLLKDRYQILDILGKGGFGKTFVARNISMPEDSLCVIKQLHLVSKDTQVRQMAKVLFDREARILGSVICHPQVPKLIEYFEDKEQFYLVQEYVKGHNLHHEVKVNGSFSEAGVKQFLSEILPIVQYLHQKNILHRDLKPANIIRRSDDCQIVLIDFGAVKHEVGAILANSNDDATTFTTFAVGTPGFVPPEQMARRPVYASDIYALGITCIYLLTGKTPKHLDSDPLTGKIYWQKYLTVSEKFAQVLEKMMALSLSERYQSVEQVLQALEMLPYEESMKQGLTIVPRNKIGYRQNGVNIPATSRHSLANSATSYLPNDIDDSTSLANDSLVSALLSQPPIRKNRLNLGAKNNSQKLQQQSRKINRLEAKETVTEKPKKQKLTAKSLLEAYQKGQRDFAEQVLFGLNLPKVCLSEINLYQANLTQANLEESDLSRANLSRISLSEAILKNANLSKAILSFANLEGADMQGTNLRGANLKFANLMRANLCGANLLGAQITDEQLAQAKTNWFTILPSGKRRL
jgi:serine/threonine-protein kinase